MVRWRPGRPIGVVFGVLGVLTLSHWRPGRPIGVVLASIGVLLVSSWVSVKLSRTIAEREGVVIVWHIRLFTTNALFQTASRPGMP